jgi:hypothetical protein
MPQASDLWRLLDGHFEDFKQAYTERFQDKFGYWRSVNDRSIADFLKCGDLQEGFARVRCPDGKHEMFVAYSCKQRCTDKGRPSRGLGDHLHFTPIFRN